MPTQLLPNCEHDDAANLDTLRRTAIRHVVHTNPVSSRAVKIGLNLDSGEGVRRELLTFRRVRGTVRLEGAASCAARPLP